MSWPESEFPIITRTDPGPSFLLLVIAIMAIVFLTFTFKPSKPHHIVDKHHVIYVVPFDHKTFIAFKFDRTVDSDLIKRAVSDPRTFINTLEQPVQGVRYAVDYTADGALKMTTAL